MATKKQKDQQPQTRAKNVTREDADFIEKHKEGLSKTTQRAKWIHSPEEHEDKPGQSLATRSREVIIQWASEREAKPATVSGTEHGDRPGVLRLNFPGYSGKDLQEIDWDDWFRSFDERQLVFLYQEHTAKGQPSNFFRIDNPEREGG